MKITKIISILLIGVFITSSSAYSADKARKGNTNVRIVDEVTQTSVRVDGSGRLLISAVATTPPDTTQVVRTAQSSINSAADTIYTITNGKTLVLQQFSAGAEENATGGSKVSLFEDPNGNLSVLNLISVLYVNGDSNTVDLTSQFTGNGTRRIVMRRNIFAGASREVFGQWVGFEE